MKKIEVREIRLTDFKGQKEKKVEFGHRTVVSGKNGCGKTTLADAFMWVFCDKDYSLKSNPDIRPDDGRECLPRVDIDLVIDGKPVSVAKFQKRTESKPKDGKPGKVALSNKYKINGVPKAERDFKADLKERGFDFDNFLMLSHMEIFTDLKDADARKILFSMSDGAGKSDLEIAKTVPDCAELVPFLETYKADEIKAMNSATLKKAEEQLEAIPNQIIGMEQSKVDADVAELELQKNALQEQIYDLKKQIAQSGNAKAGEIKAELAGLRTKLLEIESKAKADLLEQKSSVCNKVSTLELDRNIKTSELNRKTSALESLRTQKKDFLKKLQDARTQYPKIKDTEWDNTALENIESEAFKDTDTICPTCGQNLPSEQIEQLKSRFEQKKQERINQQLKAQEEWEQDKKRKLDEVIETGNKASADMKEAHKQEETLTSEISKLTEELEQIKTSLDAENKNLEAVPKEPDFSGNAEYQQILTSIKEKEQELNSLDDGEEAKKQLSEQLSGKKQELAAVNQKIGEANNNVRIDEQIEKLQESQKQYAQNKADAQMILDELKALSMVKNTALEDAVNQYFDGVKVKLFDTQKNGEVVDACIWYVQDKDNNWKKLIGNANTALMMKGKITIMNGLQKFYGVSYPIFVDCAAELDNSSLAGIKADAQLIFLKVVEGDMTVTEL
uniref:Chromosome partition protein n=1 Tax=Siphoviridae sp. ctv0N24 TaxID=2826509 RepID=A0A8S5N2W8_9CAUD|nr:MAG TPA: chromosome partition protein [Siphoviridae sp. ctv0N24]